MCAQRSRIIYETYRLQVQDDNIWHQTVPKIFDVVFLVARDEQKMTDTDLQVVRIHWSSILISYLFTWFRDQLRQHKGMTVYLSIYTTIGAALIDTSLSDIREIRHDDIWLEYDDVVDIRKSGYLAVLYEYYIHIDDLSLSWLIIEDSVTVNGIIYKVTYVSWNSGDDSFINIFNHCHIWYQILRRYSKRDM